MLRDVKLTGTTASDGSLTVNADIKINGLLWAVEWVVGSFAAGVDAVISMQNTPSGVAKTVLTLTNANANAWYNPREDEHDNTGTALTSDCFPVVMGQPRLVVSSGGDTKTGTCILYYEPLKD